MQTLILTLSLLGNLLLFAIVLYIRSQRTHHHKKCKVEWPVTLRFSNFKIKGVFIMLSLQRKQAGYGELGKPIDKNGDEAEVEAGTLKITSANPDVATIEPDETQPDNPYAFKVLSKGLGSAQVDFVADADLGEGVKPISGFFTVEVRGGEAVGFKEPTFGAVVDVPDPAV